MAKYGLIGYPIKDSKSPRLFEAAYGGVRQPDGTGYSYDLIGEDDFEASWSAFLKDYQAINVTAPFKEQAYSKILDLTRQGKASIWGPAAKIGATNLVVKAGEGIEAHNSDFTGIIISVAEAYFPGIIKEFINDYADRFFIKIHQFFRQSLSRTFTRRPQALIVGCGGAGRAAAVAAAELGFATVLMNRSVEKAHKMVQELPEYQFIVDPLSDFKEAVKECDLVVYTLPTAIPGITEFSTDDFAGSESGCGKVILEANYKTPSFAGEILNKLRFAGGTYIPGDRWLLCQALSGYSLMTGKKPDIEAMERAL